MSDPHLTFVTRLLLLLLLLLLLPHHRQYQV
jgi:hypothetical protein